jgi:hypothetical protein
MSHSKAKGSFTGVGLGATAAVALVKVRSAYRTAGPPMTQEGSKCRARVSRRLRHALRRCSPASGPLLQRFHPPDRSRPAIRATQSGPQRCG